MGPTWVLSAPDGPHVGPMNFAIREYIGMFLPQVILFDGVQNYVCMCFLEYDQRRVIFLFYNFISLSGEFWKMIESL